MIDVVVDYLVTGVNVLIQATIICTVIIMMGVLTTVNASISAEQARVSEIQLYAEYNGYDYTHVYPADVVSTVMKYRGTPNVTVSSARGTYTWTKDSTPVNYVVADIQAVVETGIVYDADIVKSASGEIIGITFEPHSAACTR